MGDLRRFPGAACLALAAFLVTGCASPSSPPGGSLGMHGRTVAEGEEGDRAEVEILSLDERSPLLGAGVRTGDRIVSVEGGSPGSAADLVGRLHAAGCANPIRLGIRSGEATREVEVVPSPCRRTFRIGLGVPFLFRLDGDGLELLPVSLVEIGFGPDAKGLVLLSCVGYRRRPDRADVLLGPLSTGTGHRIEAPAKGEDAATATPVP